MAGLRAAYADAPWSDLERIRDEAQDPRVSVADSIRFYFSRCRPPRTPGSTRATSTRQDRRDRRRRRADRALPRLLEEHRRDRPLRLPPQRRPRVRPRRLAAPARRPRQGLARAPRDEVDAEVREAFARWDVLWFGVDPSPARDDEDEALYWADLVDEWHRDFRDDVLIWATPGAKNGNAVAFDMRLSQPGGRDRVRLTEEAERTAEGDRRRRRTLADLGRRRRDAPPARPQRPPAPEPVGRLDRQAVALSVQARRLRRRDGRRPPRPAPRAQQRQTRRRKRSGKAVFVQKGGGHVPLKPDRVIEQAKILHGFHVRPSAALDVDPPLLEGPPGLPAVIPVHAPREVRDDGRIARVNVCRSSSTRSRSPRSSTASGARTTTTTTRLGRLAGQPHGRPPDRHPPRRAAYGAGYAVVLPGDPVPVIRGVSPRSMTASTARTPTGRCGRSSGSAGACGALRRRGRLLLSRSHGSRRRRQVRLHRAPRARLRRHARRALPRRGRPRRRRRGRAAARRRRARRPRCAARSRR
jgi:hypothetical protein